MKIEKTLGGRVKWSRPTGPCLCGEAGKWRHLRHSQWRCQKRKVIKIDNGPDGKPVGTHETGETRGCGRTWRQTYLRPDVPVLVDPR